MENEENKTKDEKQKSLGKRILYEILDLCKIFLLCYVFVWGITSFVARPIHVEGSSMYPTLEDGEIGLTNVFGVNFGEVKRFDIVIVNKVDRDELWIKRVIGLPGDTVYAKDDILYINDEPQEEAYLDMNYVQEMRANGTAFTDDFEPVTLGEGEYWVMGDNRPKSDDSRYHGPFMEENLEGKSVFILYPFEKMKAL